MAKGKREGKVSQKTMVETALNEKGWESGPADLQAAIKEKFGVEMPLNYISNYKSNLKKEKGKGTSKPAAKKVAASGLKFADLEAVRGLVSRLGSDQVKKLVDVADMFG